MGFMSRKVLPACGSMCVCCPAIMSPSSRKPIKRYKRLLSAIFQKNNDGTSNDRKITKLCEYAARSPHNFPEIAKFLEKRSYKELRANNTNFIQIITEIYCKLLCICKEKMAFFASSLLNVIAELLDCKQQETIKMLGCELLTRFISSQADSTYAHNIESLVHKVCNLASKDCEEDNKCLRAASLQCLAAMIWFMTKYQCFFKDIDKIACTTLQNYGIEEQNNEGNQRRDPHHNWVDEVVRSEARDAANPANDVGPITFLPQPEFKDSSTLSREERESPEVWSHICIQNLAELAKESTTIRYVFDPMFIYFDAGKHWGAGNGLALRVLNKMFYFVKSSGYEQMILSAITRHLDHKNVMHDPQMKADIVQVAICLVQHLRSRSVVAELGVAIDLCRHLRKSIQAAMEAVGPKESNWNDLLQKSIEECLLEIAKGAGDAYPLFDLMALTLEKLPSSAIVAKATIESMLVLADIISFTYAHQQLVFPEYLLSQLIKTMMHPDLETRVGAHKIFSVILVRTPAHPKCKYERNKRQSKSTSAFASAAALFEKLRKEKELKTSDMFRKQTNNGGSVKVVDEDESRNGRIWRSPPYFHKLSSAEMEINIITLNEDQIAQLLSAFWLQANQPDNLPENYEAIAHSFSLTLLSSHLKNSNHSNTLRFFQLPLSLVNASLDSSAILRPSRQRCILTLAIGMLAFAGKIYQIAEFAVPLELLISSNADPYLKIGDDLQVYVKHETHSNFFASEVDHQAVKPVPAVTRNFVLEIIQNLVHITVPVLSKMTNMETDELALQLSETFTPDDGPLFSSIPLRSWDNLQTLAMSEGSISLDEESSRTSSVSNDIINQSPATDIRSFISRVPTKPQLSPVIGVGQLLESALQVAGQVAGTAISTSPLPYGTMTSQCESLGMVMRKKLSTWLVNNEDDVVSDVYLPSLSINNHYGLAKMEDNSHVRLPPASPFDNFMRAAGC